MEKKENEVVEKEKLAEFKPSAKELVLMLLNRALNKTYNDSRSKSSLIREAIKILSKKVNKENDELSIDQIELITETTIKEE